MPSKFAEKVIKAAKAETALRLSAAETHQLATELGQMSLLIMKLLHSDLESTIEPPALVGLLCESLLRGLPAAGFTISTNGHLWWGRLDGTEAFSTADSLYALLDRLRTEAGFGPASSATIHLKGADLYKQLESLSV